MRVRAETAIICKYPVYWVQRLDRVIFSWDRNSAQEGGEDVRRQTRTLKRRHWHWEINKLILKPTWWLINHCWQQREENSRPLLAKTSVTPASGVHRCHVGYPQATNEKLRTAVLSLLRALYTLAFAAVFGIVAKIVPNGCTLETKRGYIFVRHWTPDTLIKV